MNKNWWTSENNPMKNPEIVRLVAEKNRGRKLSDEYKKKLSLVHTNNPKVKAAAMKGHEKMKEMRKNPEYVKMIAEKNRQSALRQWSNFEIRKKMCESMRGKKHGSLSDEQKKWLSCFFSERHKGSGNPAWRGGISFKYGDDWDAIRFLVYFRDRFACKKCGVTGIPLDIHHITPFRISKSNDINNLITVCKSCHRLLDAEYQKMENKNMAMEKPILVGGLV